MAQRRAAGRPLALADALIAGICHVQGATLATRNVKDLTDLGIGLINPWE